MEVILVRHAKSEPWQPNQIDFDRVLIQAGIDRLKAKIPDFENELILSLEDSDHERLPVIWVSPATRAMQTADIIAEAIDVAEIEVMEWIWEQDSYEFEQNLYTLEEDDLVIIVGHQPSLSYWAEIMTGQPVPFRTSAIVSFAKQEDDRIWYVNWELS